MAMSELIEKLLQREGPMLSSALADRLIQTHALAPATARKRVSRAPGLRRLAGLVFPRNARFVYLDQQFGSSLYWSRLTGALLSTNSAWICDSRAAPAWRAHPLAPIRHYLRRTGAPASSSVARNDLSASERSGASDKGHAACPRRMHRTSISTISWSGRSSTFTT